jgi:small subunit ribosomal protein S6
MREYELTVIYDLGVAEAGGQQAAPERLTAAVTARGGEVIKIDHWGRRRLAYPIRSAIDGDYVVSRVNLEPASVRQLEDALRIDERVYRHLVVRADELPAPPPPREPRAPRRVAEPAEGQAESVAPPAAEASQPAAAAEETPAPAEAADVTPGAEDVPASDDASSTAPEEEPAPQTE